MKKFYLLVSMAFVMASCCNTTECKQSTTTETAAQTTIDPAAYKTQNNESMEEVFKFLKDCGTYYVATVDSSNCPRVRPFGTVNMYDGKLYIQTGKSKRIAKQLAANPKAEICAFNGKEWIRIQTTLVPDERIEAKQAMLDSYPNLQSMYKADDTNTLVLFMANTTATLSSFVAPERVIQF